MKILILRFSSIGDIVLTTPVIRAVKTQRKDIVLHYCTKQSYRSILSDNPYIDKIHILQNNFSLLVKTLKAEKFDYIIDLHSNLRTRLLKIRLGVKSKSFKKLNVKKWIYVNFKINSMPAIHVVDRYMEAVRVLGVKNDGFGLDYFIPEKDQVELEWLPEPYRKTYVALAIGGQHQTKKLPLQQLIRLCDRINKPIVLLGDKNDAAVGERVAAFFNRTTENTDWEEGLKALNKNTVVFNGCGKFNLNQSASLIAQAICVFTHDTGLMHIAAAFNKKIFSIWGSTTLYFGMYPYKTSFTVFENNKLSCRPCSKIGFNKCPKGHFKCMNNLIFDFYLPD